MRRNASGLIAAARPCGCARKTARHKTECSYCCSCASQGHIPMEWKPRRVPSMQVMQLCARGDGNVERQLHPEAGPEAPIGNVLNNSTSSAACSWILQGQICRSVLQAMALHQEADGRKWRQMRSPVMRHRGKGTSRAGARTCRPTSDPFVPSGPLLVPPLSHTTVETIRPVTYLLVPLRYVGASRCQLPRRCSPGLCRGR